MADTEPTQEDPEARAEEDGWLEPTWISFEKGTAHITPLKAPKDLFAAPKKMYRRSR
jgi:hypothetical protein